MPPAMYRCDMQQKQEHESTDGWNQVVLFVGRFLVCRFWVLHDFDIVLSSVCFRDFS